MSESSKKFKMNYDVNCPSELLSDENITDTELRVYLVIRGFTKGKEKACTLSNQRISECCAKNPTINKKTGRTTYNSVEKAIRNLKEKKYIYVDTRQNRIPRRKIFVGKEAFQKRFGLSDDNPPLPKKFNNVSHFRETLINRAIGFTLRMVKANETLDLMIANNGIVNKETYELVDNESAKKMWEYCYEYKEDEIRKYIKIKEQK